MKTKKYEFEIELLRKHTKIKYYHQNIKLHS